MIRLFIAISTPSSVLPHLTEARDLLRASEADVKWEPNGKLHCTLKFLGDTRAELVRPVTETLSQIALATNPFAIVYKGIGCFPGRRDPRIVWAGMEDPEGGLKGLFEALDKAMAGLGFERERRAFQPHVTLGRVRSTHRLAVLLGMMETVTFECLPVMIHGIEIVRSTLGPGGSVYSPMAGLKLGSDPESSDRAGGV